MITKNLMCVIFFNPHRYAVLNIIIPVSSSSGYRLRSRTARSYGNSMIGFWRNRQTIFHSCRTILHSHRQWEWVTMSPRIFYLTEFLPLMGTLHICVPLLHISHFWESRCNRCSLARVRAPSYQQSMAGGGRIM